MMFDVVLSVDGRMCLKCSDDGSPNVACRIGLDPARQMSVL
jgi:hypothetical protein